MDAMGGVTDFCNQVITEVTEICFVPSTVGPHSAPEQVMEELWEVKARRERIEELLLQTYRLKEDLYSSYLANKAIYEDEWDAESQRRNASIRKKMGDYASAKEVHAEINI